MPMISWGIGSLRIRSARYSYTEPGSISTRISFGPNYFGRRFNSVVGLAPFTPEVYVVQQVPGPPSHEWNAPRRPGRKGANRSVGQRSRFERRLHQGRECRDSGGDPASRPPGVAASEPRHKSGAESSGIATPSGAGGLRSGRED